MGTYHNINNPRQLDIIYIDPRSSASSDEEAQEYTTCRHREKCNKRSRKTIFQTEPVQLNNFTGAEKPYEVPKLPKKHPWLPNRYQDMLIEWYLKCQRKSNCACSQSHETPYKAHLVRQRVQCHEPPPVKLLRIDAQFDSYNETRFNGPVQRTVNENCMCCPRILKQRDKNCLRELRRISRESCACVYPPSHKHTTKLQDSQTQDTSSPFHCNCRKPHNDSLGTHTSKMDRPQSDVSTIEIDNDMCSDANEREPSKIHLPEGNLFKKCRFWQFLGADGSPLPIGMLKSKKSPVEVWVRVEPSDSDEHIVYQLNKGNTSPPLERMEEMPDSDTQAHKIEVNIHLQDCPHDMDENCNQTVVEAPVQKPRLLDTTKPSTTEKSIQTPTLLDTSKLSTTEKSIQTPTLLDTSKPSTTEKPVPPSEGIRPITKVILETNDTRVFPVPPYPPAAPRLSINSVQYPTYRLPHYSCPHHPSGTQLPNNDSPIECSTASLEQTSPVTTIPTPKLSEETSLEHHLEEDPPTFSTKNMSKPISKSSLENSSLKIQSNSELASRLMSTSIFTESHKSQSKQSDKIDMPTSNSPTQESETDKFIKLFGSSVLQPTQYYMATAKVQEVPWSITRAITPVKEALKHESYHKLELSQFDPYFKDFKDSSSKLVPPAAKHSWTPPPPVKRRSPSSFPPPDNASPFWNSLSKSQEQSDNKKDDILKDFSPLLYAPYSKQINITALPSNTCPAHPKTCRQFNEPSTSPVCRDTSSCLQNPRIKVSVHSPQLVVGPGTISTDNTQTTCKCLKNNKSSNYAVASKSTQKINDESNRYQLYSTDVKKDKPSSNVIKSNSAPLISLQGVNCSCEKPVRPLPAVKESTLPLEAQTPMAESPSLSDKKCISLVERFDPLSVEKPIQNFCAVNPTTQSCSKASETCTCCKSELPCSVKEMQTQNVSFGMFTTQSPSKICNCQKPKLSGQMLIKNAGVTPSTAPNKTCICDKPESPPAVMKKPIQNLTDRTLTTQPSNNTCICNKLESPRAVIEKPIQNFCNRTPTQPLNKTCICNKPESPQAVIEKPIQNFRNRTPTQPLNNTCICNTPESPQAVIEKPIQNFRNRTPTQPLNNTCICNTPESPQAVIEKPIQNFSNRTPTQPLNNTCICNTPESPQAVIEKPIQNFSNRIPTQPLNKTCICNKLESPQAVIKKPIQNFSNRTPTQPLNNTCICNTPESPQAVIEKPIQNLSDRTQTTQSRIKTCICKKPQSPRVVIQTPIQNFSDRTGMTQYHGMFHEKCGCHKPQSPPLSVKKPIQTCSETMFRTRSPGFDDERLVVNKHTSPYFNSEKQKPTAIASLQTDNEIDDSCISKNFGSTQTSFTYAAPLGKNNDSRESLNPPNYFAIKSTQTVEHTLAEVKIATSSCKQTYYSTRTDVLQTPNTKVQTFITTMRSCENLSCESCTGISWMKQLPSNDTANRSVHEGTELAITSSSAPLHGHVPIKEGVGPQSSRDIPECESLHIVQSHPHTTTLPDTETQDVRPVQQTMETVPDLQTDELQTTPNNHVCICKSAKRGTSVKVLPTLKPCRIATTRPEDSDTNQTNYLLIPNVPTFKSTNKDAPMSIITDQENLYSTAINFDDDEEEIFCEPLSSSSQLLVLHKTESKIDTSPNPFLLGEWLDETSSVNLSLPVTSGEEVENEVPLLEEEETASMGKTHDIPEREAGNEGPLLEEETASMGKTHDIPEREAGNEGPLLEEETASMHETHDDPASLDEHPWEGMTNKPNVYYYNSKMPKIFFAQPTQKCSARQNHAIKRVLPSAIDTQDPCFGETHPHTHATGPYRPNMYCANIVHVSETQSQTNHPVASMTGPIKPTKRLHITTAEREDPCFHEDYDSSEQDKLSSRSSTIYYAHIPSELYYNSQESTANVYDPNPFPAVEDVPPRQAKSSIYYAHIPSDSSYRIRNSMAQLDDPNQFPVVEDVPPRHAKSSSSNYYAHIPSASPYSSREAMVKVDDSNPFPVVEDVPPRHAKSSSSNYYAHIPSASPYSSREAMVKVDDSNPFPVVEDVPPRHAKSSSSNYYAHIPSASPYSSREAMVKVDDSNPFPVVEDVPPRHAKSSSSNYYAYIPSASPYSSREAMVKVDDSNPFPVVEDVPPRHAKSSSSNYYAHIPSASPYSSREAMVKVDDSNPFPVAEDVTSRHVKSSQSIYYAALPYRGASSSESIPSEISSENTSVRFTSAVDVLGFSTSTSPDNEKRDDRPPSKRKVAAKHDAT